MKTRLARFAGILMTAGLMTAAAPAVTAAGPRPTPAHAHAAAGPRPTPAHAAAGCPGAAAVPTRRTLGRAARATVCLLNGQRAANGLRPLRPNRALDRSARRYAHALVANHFFSHVAPNGQTLPARISRSGYLRGARGYAYGENLAWGAGVRATPLQIVRSWLASPPHRENILNARYRNIGIGIAPGAPVRGVSHAASYVTHFGWRG
jgi:uncharacterized protein YkwD